MAVREIIKEGNALLSKVCSEVTSFDSDLKDLLTDLKDTLKESGGIGLAAPQIGVLKRVVVIDLNGETFELINPKIINESGEQRDLEGCLSCPGEFGITKRPMKVTVKAKNPLGKEVVHTGKELLARAFCHELDHLDGVLFKKHVIHMLTEEELSELEKAE